MQCGGGEIMRERGESLGGVCPNTPAPGGTVPGGAGPGLGGGYLAVWAGSPGECWTPPHMQTGGVRGHQPDTASGEREGEWRGGKRPSLGNNCQRPGEPRHPSPQGLPSQSRRGGEAAASQQVVSPLAFNSLLGGLRVTGGGLHCVPPLGAHIQHVCGFGGLRAWGGKWVGV